MTPSRISAIPNDVQNRKSAAWRKLCEYVNLVADDGADEFVPREYLGNELFDQIFTLPETIARLTRVRKIGLYGSKLKRIPPEIGAMESLEYFDPYTSYDLHWLPYELTRCKNLKDSRISTRALYGNYKNRMGFPRLDKNPVRYDGPELRCSVCDKVITYEETDQLWTSLKVATDIVPLLANVCSFQCRSQLPAPPENYIPHPHKGGSKLVQPPDEAEFWMQKRKRARDNGHRSTPSNQRATPLKRLFKPIWKIWEKKD